MISSEERNRIAKIKRAAEVGTATDADKQWVLDMVRREQVIIKRTTKLIAAGQGFNVSGIATKG